MFLSFQELMAEISTSIIKNILELTDEKFKNSAIRKEKYYINKSNVEWTIITIFDEITFKRTLYQHKLTNEYYIYVDDVFGIEAYKNYDPIVRGILIQDSVLKNPNQTANYSPLNFFHLKQFLKRKTNIPKQTIYKFKQDIKLRNIEYDEIPHQDTLYVMVDEKWIHKQDKKKPNKKK